VTIAAVPSTTQASLGVFLLQTSHASTPDLILSSEDRNDLIANILSLRPRGARRGFARASRWQGSRDERRLVADPLAAQASSTWHRPCGG
jgi:hypothetical protein